MNIYVMIGNNVGSRDAVELGERLSAWHDAMVAHERRPATPGGCGDDCPHVEAGTLWREAVATFGPYAADLKFLRSRGMLGVPVRERRTAAAR